MKVFSILPFLILGCNQVSGQTNLKAHLFKDILIQTDSGNYSKMLNTIQIKSEENIWFNYFYEDEVCRIKLYPDSTTHFKTITLQESADYDIIDSLRYFNNQYYDFKLRFKHLTKSDFLKFTVRYSLDSVKLYYDVHLFPLFKTSVRLSSNTNELTVGEEKVIELIANNAENVVINPDWDVAGYQLQNY